MDEYFDELVTREEMVNTIEVADSVLRTEYLGLIGDVKDLLDEVNGEVI